MERQFNEAQEQAVTHFKGPALVLAGPGSGKTFVITQRTRYLIEQYGVNPRNILVITFTKAAATEMRERFEQLMNGEITGVSFGTFHAIFFNILKYAYNFNGSNILKEELKYQILHEIISEMNVETEDEKELIENLISEISYVKGSGIAIENYYSLNCSEVSFQDVYKSYNKKLMTMNKVDFDDMMVLCLELFQQRKDILAMWQKRYQYIMVDEAQDSNYMQYQITKLLAGDTKNLFMVGDDDQSLYRFRGAKPEIMLNFGNDFPDVKQIVLVNNYRSQKKIVDGALRVIENNTNRFPKNIQAVRAPGDDILVAGYETMKEENQAIVDKIMEFVKKGGNFKDTAVLFRTNKQPRALVGLLMAYNIPFRMKDSIPNIYDHWIAKNLAAYIKLAIGSRDRSLFLEVMNRPKRYFKRECLADPEVSFDAIRDYYKDKPYMVERVYKLEYDLNVIKKMPPYGAIQYIRNAVGYDKYLEEYAQFRNMKPDDLYEILDELMDSAKEFKTYQEWFAYMKEYEENLREQSRMKKDVDEDCLALMTFHGCKGLEFKNVFIIDANEEITPHRKALNQADMEEERRMFYVAMTRAKDRLFITYAKERYEKKLQCSRFVGELLTNASSIKENARVRHRMYGKGTVIKIADGKCMIKFDKNMVPKVLNFQFCIQNQLLELLEESK